MRKNETEEIRAVCGKRDLDFIYIDARSRFIKRLEGVTDPETKRKRIGDEFVRTFEDAAKNCGNPEFLAQGTIYPDIVESGKHSAVIKSHHNVGGCLRKWASKELWSLAGLSRRGAKLGLILGLPKNYNPAALPRTRLSIRIIGEVTRKAGDLREATHRREETACPPKADHISRFDEHEEVGVWATAARTNTPWRCAPSDQRHYDRRVRTSAYQLLAKMSSRITNEVAH
jgi:GMP synthase (glutamine-hydrolysing)